MEKIKARIKVDSRLAAVAAKRMKSERLAMVVGTTIHLHGTTREEFLSDIHWVRHEACHLHQYREYGTWRFLYCYVVEWIRKGYYNNHFEVAARAAERDPGVLRDVEIL